METLLFTWLDFFYFGILFQEEIVLEYKCSHMKHLSAPWFLLRVLKIKFMELPYKIAYNS